LEKLSPAIDNVVRTKDTVRLSNFNVVIVDIILC
jgi:hypothetical protein